MSNSFFFEQIRFRYMSVGYFNPRSSFSCLRPLLESSFKDGENEMGVTFPQIFNTDVPMEVIDRIKKLTETVKIVHHKSETKVVLEVAEKVLIPLFGNITFEANKKYSQAMPGRRGWGQVKHGMVPRTFV